MEHLNKLLGILQDENEFENPETQSQIVVDNVKNLDVAHKPIDDKIFKTTEDLLSRVKQCVKNQSVHQKPGVSKSKSSKSSVLSKKKLSKEETSGLSDPHFSLIMK